MPVVHSLFTATTKHNLFYSSFITVNKNKKT